MLWNVLSLFVYFVSQCLHPAIPTLASFLFKNLFKNFLSLLFTSLCTCPHIINHNAWGDYCMTTWVANMLNENGIQNDTSTHNASDCWKTLNIGCFASNYLQKDHPCRSWEIFSRLMAILTVSCSHIKALGWLEKEESYK